MAARVVKIRHDAETRAKIQSSQLINALEKHVLKRASLVPSQVSAALGLLRKTIPDLVNTTVSGDKNNPLVMLHEKLSDSEAASAYTQLRNDDLGKIIEGQCEEVNTPLIINGSDKADDL